MELANAMLRQIGGIKDVIYDEGALYLYRKAHGLWGPVTDDDASRIIQSFAGIPTQGAYRVAPLRVNASDITGTVKVAHDQARKPRFFAEAPVGLSFSNGFVEVSAQGIKLKPLSRDNLARSGYNCPYDPKAKSLVFLAFLHSIFRDDSDRVEKIAFLQELFGASLIQAATRYQKCALLIGDGENGKDTLIDVLQSVFPPGTVSAVAPHKWSHDYTRARLAGIWLNVIGELPESDLDASEAFKSIVVGGEIDARYPYGRVFNFRPVAGHVFAANANMGTPDFSHGFFRRFGVIRFNRTFTAAERDVTIKDRLIATEMPAIITWLVEGAQRLMARGAYALPASHHTELAAWRLSADQVAMFLENRTRPLAAGESGTLADFLYQEFSSWAEENGHKRMTSTKFGVRAKLILKERGLPEPARNKRGMVYPITTRKGEGVAFGLGQTRIAKKGSNIISLR